MLTHVRGRTRNAIFPLIEGGNCTILSQNIVKLKWELYDVGVVLALHHIVITDVS